MIPIYMFYSGPPRARRIEACLEAGVDGLVFLAESLDAAETHGSVLRRLDELAEVV